MSKVTAVAYYGGIPPYNNNLEKPLILNNFINGVNAAGDSGISHRGMNAIPCDVAFIQGFVHDDGKNLPHLKLRKDAINLQKKNKKKSLICDSNLFLYADPDNTKTYLRYSFDGVFPTTGFYFDQDIDPARWKKLSANLGISLKPYRSTGNHILLCLQRNGGWSMRGLPVMDWINQTIYEIRKYSSRHIIVRAHPGDKKVESYLKINHPNTSVSRNKRLLDDFKNAWATVVYNSSPSVASAIEGIPIFLTDSHPEYSQSQDVANFDLSKIENPNMPDRQAWIERLAMCHWNFDELRSGEAWQFFKRYI